MSRKNSKVKLKYKRNIGGLAVMYAVATIMGAIGVAGWLLGPGDLIARSAYAALAFAAAFVVPVGAGQLGRSWASSLMLPIMLLGACWTAYSIEHANKVLVEAPLEAAHDAAQAEALARLSAAKGNLADAQAAVVAYAPLVLDPSMPKGRVEAQERTWNTGRAAVVANVTAAEQAVETAQADVEPYVPSVPWWAVLAFGAAIDAFLALAIFSLESTARGNRQKAEEALRREREYAAKNQSQRAQPAKRGRAKKQQPDVVTGEEAAFLLQARGPRLVVDNG